jgi:hypothetical protein
MKTVKVYQYRIKDSITGRQYLTRYKLTEEDTAKRYPERERLEATEEIRNIYEDVHSPHQLVFGGQRPGPLLFADKILPQALPT